jgi:uncharacterized membrane protein
MAQLQPIVLSVAALLVIDIAYLSASKPMYAKLVEKVQGARMVIDLASAIVAYAFVVFAFIALVVPRVNTKQSIGRSFCEGALVGLIVYAIFNATNKAMFTQYALMPACVDTLWGTTLFGIGAAMYRACLS